MQNLPEMTIQAWATIATITTQIVLVIVVYVLSKAGGRAQTRHEKAAEAIVEALRLTRRVATECGVWALYHTRNTIELKYRAEVLGLRGELQDLVYNNSPWLEPGTEDKVRPVIKGLSKVTSDHIAALKSGDEAQAQESGERLYEWSTNELVQMQNDLNNEARHIIGTKRHWTSTRWGMPLAWVTRTTRFFVAYRWVQRKVGRRIGTVLAVLGVTLVGVSIYWFATGAPTTALVLFALVIGILLGYYLPQAPRHSN